MTSAFKAKLANLDSSRRGRTSKGVLTTVLRAVEIAIDGISIAGAKAAVGELVLIMDGLNQTSRNTEALNAIRDQLSRLVEEVLNPVLNKARSESLKEQEEAIERLMSDLYGFALEWKESVAKGSVTRFFRREDDAGDLQRLSARIREALDRFNIGTGIRLEVAADEVKTVAVAVQDTVESHAEQILFRERSKLVAAMLHAKQASYHSGGKAIRRTCFEGTRIGILATTKAWIDNADIDAPRLLWLSGIAGIGKSTIAHTIAQQAYLAGYLGASFFCSRQEADLSNPSLIFPTIAYQLAQLDKGFKQKLGEVLENDGEIAFQSRQTQLEQLILEPLSHIHSTAQPILVVIDAFDECNESGAKEILQPLLAATSRPSFPIKILFTSRPEPHISSVFNQASHFQKAVLHDLEKSIVRGDINLYLKAELELVPRKLDVPLPPGWVDPTEVEALVGQAGDLFVYAATVLLFVGDEKVCNPRTQLNIILSLRQASNVKPYAALDELYLQVLRNLVSGLNATILDRFHKVVGSLVLLRNPLPLVALETLADVEPGDGRAALRHLQSLIVIPASDDGIPRICHPSFPEFITNPTRCIDPNFQILTGKVENRLALRCLSIMTSSLKRNMIGFSDPSVRNEEVADLAVKVGERVPAELDYACRFWATHLSRAEYVDEALVQKLEEFLSRHLLFWMELMSFMSSVRLAVTCVKEAHTRAVSEFDRSFHHLVDLLNDAHRFLLANQDSIQSSAPHVYHSALPFTPKATKLYKLYAHEASHAIRVTMGEELDWSRCLGTLTGHSQDVVSVKFSPNGSYLASGSEDGTVRLWDGQSATPLAELKGHSNGVEQVAFSPNSTRIASAALDKTIRLWEVVGTHVATLQGHANVVHCVAFSPDGKYLASGSNDRTIRIWNADSGVQILTIKGHRDSVSSVVFSPDGSRLASGSHDRTVRLWDVANGVEIAILRGHSKRVNAVALCRGGSRLASGSTDKTIRLWDAVTGDHKVTLTGHTDKVTSVAFSSSGASLVSGSGDGTVRVWDIERGMAIMVLERQATGINSVAFSPDGSRVVSGSTTVQLWDVTSRLTKGSRELQGEIIGSDADQHRGVPSHLSSHEETLPQQHPTSDAEMPNVQINVQSTTVLCFAFSEDGSRLASGSSDGTVQLWDVERGTSVQTSNLHSDQVRCVAFSPESSVLASASNDATVRLWDPVSGSLRLSMAGHGKGVEVVAFSPDGSTIASGSEDTTVRLWDVLLGVHTTTLEGHRHAVTTITYSSDSSRLATSDEDDIRLWDAASATLINTLRKQRTVRMFSPAFSPDGSVVASASSAKKIDIWNAVSGKHIKSLGRHPERVTSVAFSCDGEYVITRSRRETLVWDHTTVYDAGGFARNPSKSIMADLDIGPSSKLLSSPADTVEVSLYRNWLVLSRGWNAASQICRIPGDYSKEGLAERVIRRKSKVALLIGGRVMLLDLSGRI